MTLQVRRSLAFLLCNILATAGYLAWAWLAWGQSLGVTPDQPALWAGLLLAWVPLQLVSRILVTIALAVANHRKKDREDMEMEDEMDKLIDLKGGRLMTNCFLLGLGGALVALALGSSLGLFFAIVLGAMVASSLVGDLVILRWYRRGL